MTVLALDSCRRNALCALLAGPDGETVEGGVFEGPLAQTTPQAISKYLRADCRGVVVVVGPGSYTGIRAGIAAAKALFSARSVKLYMTDRLTALAAVHNIERSASVLEAGRGGIYAQTFTGGNPPSATSQPGHYTLSQWSPPSNHEIVCDFDLPDGRRCEPLDILAAATRVALNAGEAEPSRVRALYVSQPEFTKHVLNSSAK
jgi:tRNA threonylcarbamoyl adenosine modification protein YeaZ